MDQDFMLLRMDDESFTKLSTYVTREYGIKLPDSKRSMLESRLNKKVKSLGMNSYKEFMTFLFSPDGVRGELYEVIDLITTNKTDFFREAGHFRFLADNFLPSYLDGKPHQALNIWSAGCSSGEEPYTLVMVLEEYKDRNRCQLNYRLLASDISVAMLQTAYQGIYDNEKTAPIPMDMKRKYFLRGQKDPSLVRVKPDYRKLIQYKRINLMDTQYGLRRSEFDFIFCRNVLIYFDKPTQEAVIRKFCQHLKPGGLLFLGHSESIMGMNLNLKQVSTTVYQLQ